MSGSRRAVDGVLLLDKPAGITSTRALAIAKRRLEAAKAGHTGTLDPFATGLLPLAFGEAAKFSRFLLDARKEYDATLKLGEETTTGDIEGIVTHSCEIPADPDKIDEILNAFQGPQEQRPPMHSAVHVAGRRLYEYAREGLEVAREMRRVEIFELRRLGFEGVLLSISVTCSKGTYLRVLAQDIGRALGCGAHLVALRRTAIGPFTLRQAIPLADVEREAAEWGRSRLLPITALLDGLVRCETTDEQSRHFQHGQPIETGAPPGAEVAVYDPSGQFLGVGRSDAGRLVPVRLMATGDSFRVP